jgi:S1-C subfamily serine protease
MIQVEVFGKKIRRIIASELRRSTMSLLYTRNFIMFALTLTLIPTLLRAVTPMRDLPLTAQTVYGVWLQDNRTFPDTVQWNGSSFVLRQEPGYLILVTNRHCLGLEDIISASELRLPAIPQEDTGLAGFLFSAAEAAVGNVESIIDPSVAVAAYELYVVFDTEEVVRVESFKYAEGNDIALLRIPATGLVEGNDYLIPEYLPDNIQIGAETAAVGAPYGLGSSVTFGRISALRNQQSSYGNEQVLFIQTDAAINFGNSGGPLMVSNQGGNYTLAGINTMKHLGEGLGFAIEFSELDGAAFSNWFTANASGVHQALGF